MVETILEGLPVDSTGSSFGDTLLQYGLFAGAIFQIVCILAVIFIKDGSEGRPGDGGDGGEVTANKAEPANSITNNAAKASRRADKKKRR